MLMERITEKQNDQNELEAKLDAICSNISSLSNSKNKLSKDIQDVQNTVSNIMCPTIGDISEFFDSHQIDLTQQLSPIINTLSQDIILAKESISQKFNNLRNELNQQHINSKIYLKLKLKKIKDQLSELIHLLAVVTWVVVLVGLHVGVLDGERLSIWISVIQM